MSEPSSHPPSPLRTVVIAMSVPEAILARFRPNFRRFGSWSRVMALPTDDDSVTVRATPTEDDLRDADAIVGWELPSHLLQATNRLRWMHAAGAGVERYDLAQIAARGVMLTNSKRRFGAEHGGARAGHDDRADPSLPSIAAGADPARMARRGDAPRGRRTAGPDRADRRYWRGRTRRGTARRGVRDARQRSAATRRRVTCRWIRPDICDWGSACGAGGCGPCRRHPPEHAALPWSVRCGGVCRDEAGRRHLQRRARTGDRHRGADRGVGSPGISVALVSTSPIRSRCRRTRPSGTWRTS